MDRAASASLWFGLIGLAGIFLDPPPYGCTGGALFPLAALGILGGGLAGLPALLASQRRMRAAAGLGLSILAAVPLIRAPVGGPSNESVAIGDIRMVISVETAYSEANGGYYDKIECLQRPGDCLPDYPSNAPTFLDAAMSTPRRHGYDHSFHYGPAATEGRSPSSLKAFAYVAVPTVVNETGSRGFCGDSTGRICFTADGAAPRIVRGLCDASKESSCSPLQ
jgi:hypothetical protein